MRHVLWPERYISMKTKNMSYRSSKFSAILQKAIFIHKYPKRSCFFKLYILLGNYLLFFNYIDSFYINRLFICTDLHAFLSICRCRMPMILSNKKLCLTGVPSLDTVTKSPFKSKTNFLFQLNLWIKRI